MYVHMVCEKDNKLIMLIILCIDLCFRGIMNNEEEKRCPLCAEEMDWTGQQLNPCKCG